MKRMLKMAFTVFVLLLLPACAEEKKDGGDLPGFFSVVEIKEQGETDGETENKSAQENLPLPQYTEYDILLDVNPETNIINGIQRVIYTNKSQTKLLEVCFNLYLNAFAQDSNEQPYFNSFSDKIFENGRDYGYIEISSVMAENTDLHYDVDGTVLSVMLDEALEKGDSIEIVLVFEAYIPQINHRTGANDNALWLGNFLPVLAVHENGRWRTDPYYPAGDPFYSEIGNYNVTINTPEQYRVVATGVETSKEDNGMKTTVATAKLVRDFAFVMIDRSYKVISVMNKDGIEINMYYRSNISNVDSYIKTAEQSMNYFNETVGLYPYQQLDIVEVGLYAQGGMAYPQIIFIDGEYLQQSSSINTLAHEIGHQWFYNIVGSDQIRNPWLDEGLVSMLQENIFTQDQLALNLEFEQIYRRLEDNLTSANSFMLTDDVSRFRSFTDYYNTHYTKGKLMIYSLRLKMGEEKFYEFVKEYYQRFSFKNAGMSDFILTAEEIYGESLVDFFDAWLFGRDLPPLN